MFVLYFTPLIMRGEKIAIRTISCYLSKKGSSAWAGEKEINNAEGRGSVNKLVAQNWFRHFKEGDTSLVDWPKSGRLSFVENEALLEWLIDSQTQTLIYCRQNSVLHKASSIDTAINLALWKDGEMFEIWKKQQTFQSTWYMDDMGILKSSWPDQNENDLEEHTITLINTFSTEFLKFL